METTMPGRLFLHEHIHADKTAQVYRDLEIKRYWVLGYRNGTQHFQQDFLTEHEAEDYAEDWVLKPE